jgi:hypothetical protein
MYRACWRALQRLQKFRQNDDFFGQETPKEDVSTVC